MRRLTILLALLVVRAIPAAAQASIVPVTHPVYDWLLEQRVDGRLPTYQHEVRPMSRGTIIAHLHTLAAMEERLGRRDLRLLNEFRNEFEMDRLIAKRGWTREFVRGLPGSIAGAIRDRLDPVLAAHQDSLISYALYASIGGGLLQSADTGITQSAYATTKAVRAFINTSFGLGWHFEADNIWTASNGNLVRRISRYDSDALKPGSTASYEYDSFISWRAGRWFSMDLGWGGQALGAAVTDPLVLRSDAPPFGSLRIQLGGPRLNLVYVHGALRSQTVDDTVGTPQLPTFGRQSPDRHFVAHRVTWMPNSRLSLSAHEELIYANRGPDLNYLNPVVPMLLAQARLGDRDNLLGGGDAVFRPWAGTELKGSFIIDDRSAPNPAATTIGPFKKAMLVGVEQRVVSGVRLGLSYTETDPWMYSHWLRLNTYETNGKPLGPAMGPNAEELAVRVTTWLPLRTHVMLGYRNIKRGLDPVGASSDIALCVGGNMFCGTSGSVPPAFNKETRLYKGAEVHVIARRELEALSEPIKGVPLTLNIRDDRVLRGTQLKSSRFVDLRIRLGF